MKGKLNIIRTRAEEVIKTREYTDLDRIVKSKTVNRTLNKRVAVLFMFQNAYLQWENDKEYKILNEKELSKHIHVIIL